MKKHHIVNIKNPRKFMTLIYVSSLIVIAILSIISHLVLDSVIEKQSDSAHYINISGQQRMLSQRASLFALDYIYSGSTDAKELAQEALETMAENHAFLLSEHKNAIASSQISPLSEEMKSIYFEEPVSIERKFEKFSSLITSILEGNIYYRGDRDAIDWSFLQFVEQSMLDAFNRAVIQYEKESLQDVDTLRFAQQVVLSILLLTVLLEGVFIFRPMVNKITHFANLLMKEANYDYLTEIFNRRAFFLIAEKVFSKSKRYSNTFSIILIDIDKFKSINDDYGHDVGDKVIRHVADTLKNELRESDIVARYGGEEFIVLLPETSMENAEEVAEKIRRKIAKSSLSVSDDVHLSFTISSGVSSYGGENVSLNEVISFADEGLYQAKNSGRNQVVKALIKESEVAAT